MMHAPGGGRLESFTGHKHGVYDVQDQPDTGKFSAAGCWKVALMIQYLINLLKDGTYMNCNHGVSWVYGSEYISHPG